MPVTTCFFLLQRFSYEAESEAYKYLANYHLKQGNLDAAQAASQKCSEFTEVMTLTHTHSMEAYKGAAQTQGPQFHYTLYNKVRPQTPLNLTAARSIG